MTKRLSYVVIGNGITGVTAAEILRTEDATAEITVIADDPFPVYYRPALKDYLAGHVHEDKLWARPTSFYQDHHIRFLPERVVSIGSDQHVVELRNGRHVEYHRLLLANGARARRLRCPGLGLEGVITLRTIADYQVVLSRLNMVRRVVVVGSGTLALETSESLCQRGYEVSHLIRNERLWSEVLDLTASDLVLQQERRAGVDVHLSEEIAEVIGAKGEVTGVMTKGGKQISCEMVIIAIGIEPTIDFIKKSGIPCGRGVQVDDSMHTLAPDIYAAGDVIETTDRMTGRPRVVGQWYPAVQQARAAAYSMLDLLDTRRSCDLSLFYNATFLYGLDFATVGLTGNVPLQAGCQEIIADPQPRTYRKVLLKDGIPIGILFLGDRSNALAFKRAIDHSVNLLPVASQLFIDTFNLNDWLDRQGIPPAMLGASRRGDAVMKESASREVNGADPQKVTTDLYDANVSQESQWLLDEPVLNDDSAPLLPGAEHAIPADIVAVMDAWPTLVVVPDSSSTEQERIPTVFFLKKKKHLTLGRDKDNDIVLADASVSRKHAEVFRGPEGVYIHDMSSSNGVMVNQMKIDNPYRLSHGDRIAIGALLIYFFHRHPDALRISETGHEVRKQV